MYQAFFLCFFVAVFCWSCDTNTPTSVDVSVVDSIPLAPTSNNIFHDNFKENKEIYEQVFPFVLDSTYYKKPKELLLRLNEYYGQKNIAQTTIVAFERHLLYGIPDSVWFINCHSTLEGYGCNFPTMHTQYIFNASGKLIHKNEAASAEFVPLIKDSIYVYMSVDHDCNGEGQHHFYIYEHGKLIDVFNVLMNDTPKTFDANPEKGMFRKNQLQHQVQDLNQDGYNDIILTGKWLVLENETGKKYTPTRPFKTELVEYKFLYKPTKEYFLMEK